MAKIPLMMATPQAERSCGECRACCTVVGVHELNKPVYTPCVHECDRGCAIYAERPPSCAGYYCLYQNGALEGDERRRPDKIGFILDTTSTDPNLFVAWEVWEGAFNSDTAKYVLRRIAEKRLVYMKFYNSNRRVLLGPDNLKKPYIDKMTGQAFATEYN